MVHFRREEELIIIGEGSEKLETGKVFTSRSCWRCHLNQREFDQWCQTLNLPAATKELIASIRAAPPARRVQGRANNVSGTYPSRKMGMTIQFESHKVELWAIYQMEHDQEVLEFYDQPPSFKIQYTNQSGRQIGHYHTPDFFVLRSDGAAWEEWKTSAQLQRLSEKYPTRYQKAEDGLWRCPPGEAHAEPLGLKYQVRTDGELHPIFIQNLMFLEDYLRFNEKSYPTESRTGKGTSESLSWTDPSLPARW